MLKYLNGVILRQIIPDEVSLTITTSDNEGQGLLQNLPIIIKEYGKHISCLCLISESKENYELSEIFKQAHKAGLKTCLHTKLDDISKINMNLLSNLDYVKLSDNLLMKDYSPFGDIEDWIDVTNRCQLT